MLEDLDILRLEELLVLVDDVLDRLETLRCEAERDDELEQLAVVDLALEGESGKVIHLTICLGTIKLVDVARRHDQVGGDLDLCRDDICW